MTCCDQVPPKPLFVNYQSPCSGLNHTQTTATMSQVALPGADGATTPIVDEPPRPAVQECDLTLPAKELPKFVPGCIQGGRIKTSKCLGVVFVANCKVQWSAFGFHEPVEIECWLASSEFFPESPDVDFANLVQMCDSHTANVLRQFLHSIERSKALEDDIRHADYGELDVEYSLFAGFGTHGLRMPGGDDKGSALRAELKALESGDRR